jgi:hypothetical protein
MGRAYMANDSPPSGVSFGIIPDSKAGQILKSFAIDELLHRPVAERLRIFGIDAFPVFREGDVRTPLYCWMVSRPGRGTLVYINDTDESFSISGTDGTTPFPVDFQLEDVDIQGLDTDVLLLYQQEERNKYLRIEEMDRRDYVKGVPVLPKEIRSFQGVEGPVEEGDCVVLVVRDLESESAFAAWVDAQGELEGWEEVVTDSAQWEEISWEELGRIGRVRKAPEGNGFAELQNWVRGQIRHQLGL